MSEKLLRSVFKLFKLGRFIKYTRHIILSSLGINLSLAFLVQFNLGRGGSGGLSKTLSHVLKLTRQVGSLPLSLSTSLPLSLKLLIDVLIFIKSYSFLPLPSLQLSLGSP